MGLDNTDEAHSSACGNGRQRHTGSPGRYHRTEPSAAGCLRNIEVEPVTKMLACGTRISGVKEYHCDNAQCPHVRYITNACHSRACPSCGKKATDLWIAAQLNQLPDCDWQHLVFTLPDTL
ncbi:IS1294 orf [Erwinia tracheiphila PSU-1]|nr:IS1294 orf [Erwinia tracheiphila PSU-1]